MADKATTDKGKPDKGKVESKTKKNDQQLEKPKRKFGSILKIILILLILVILAAAGFAVGIYLKFIDMQSLAEKWKLNEYPVIGQYFSPPTTNFEPVETEPQDPVVVPPDPNQVLTQTQTQAQIPIVPPMAQPEGVLPEKRKVDDVELQKQAKIKQQEEAKRISKLSRLYSAMKPDEATAILNQMDDETVLLILNKMEDEQAAKIMALFDARRAAMLSQSMLTIRSTN